MSAYGMFLPGIGRVLDRTGKAARGFEVDMKTLPRHLASTGSACGDSGAIVPALEKIPRAMMVRCQA